MLSLSLVVASIQGQQKSASMWLKKSKVRVGLGYMLLNHLIRDSEDNDLWTLEAGIFHENTVSINLHKSCGFREVCRREKFGNLNGKWRDVLLMERRSTVVL
jgi:L-amino acid N-acyltransferase YncA